MDRAGSWVLGAPESNPYPEGMGVGATTLGHILHIPSAGPLWRRASGGYSSERLVKALVDQVSPFPAWLSLTSSPRD